MLIPNNRYKEKILLNSVEKDLLEFTPVCDLFDESDKLFFPGSRTIQVDFLKGEVKLSPDWRQVQHSPVYPAYQ
jgi:hypothetical protein